MTLFSKAPQGPRFFEVIHFSPRFMSCLSTNLIGYLLKLMATSADWAGFKSAFIFYVRFPSPWLPTLHADEARSRMDGRTLHEIEKWPSSPSPSKWENIADNRWPPIVSSSLFRCSLKAHFHGEWFIVLRVKGRTSGGTAPSSMYLLCYPRQGPRQFPLPWFPHL